MKKLYGGIDLHGHNSVVVVLDEEDQVQYQKRLPNELAKILPQLAPFRTQLQGLVVESTYNWYWLVDGLQEAGYVVHLANPAAMQQYAGLKYTNDDTDARWLAHLLRLGVLPTGFEKRRAGWGLAGSDSPLLDGFSWRSSEVADQLLRMKTAEPDATSYTIKIEVPRGISTVMLLIAWYPSSQRIAVRDRGKQWATRDPVGERLESLRSADAELFKDLRSCTRRGTVPEECPAPATWPDGM